VMHRHNPAAYAARLAKVWGSSSSPVAGIFRRRGGVLPVRAAFLDDAVDDPLEVRVGLGGRQRHNLVGVGQHQQRAGLDAFFLAHLSRAVAVLTAVLALLGLSLAEAFLAVLVGAWAVGFLWRALRRVIFAAAVGLVGIVGTGLEPEKLGELQVV